MEVVRVEDKPGNQAKTGADADNKSATGDNPEGDEAQEPRFRGKSALQRTATTQSELFEFGDDETNERKLKATGNQFFFPEFEVVAV